MHRQGRVHLERQLSRRGASGETVMRLLMGSNSALGPRTGDMLLPLRQLSQHLGAYLDLAATSDQQPIQVLGQVLRVLALRRAGLPGTDDDDAAAAVRVKMTAVLAAFAQWGIGETGAVVLASPGQYAELCAMHLGQSAGSLLDLLLAINLDLAKPTIVLEGLVSAAVLPLDRCSDLQEELEDPMRYLRLVEAAAQLLRIFGSNALGQRVGRTMRQSALAPPKAVAKLIRRAARNVAESAAVSAARGDALPLELLRLPAESLQALKAEVQTGLLWRTASADPADVARKQKLKQKQKKQQRGDKADKGTSSVEEEEEVEPLFVEDRGGRGRPRRGQPPASNKDEESDDDEDESESSEGGDEDESSSGSNGSNDSGSSSEEEPAPPVHRRSSRAEASAAASKTRKPPVAPRAQRRRSSSVRSSKGAREAPAAKKPRRASRASTPAAPSPARRSARLSSHAE